MENNQLEQPQSKKKIGVMIMLSLFLVVFLVSIVSAFSVENAFSVKSYDKQLQKITIENRTLYDPFGWFTGNKVADLQLKTPLMNNVSVGYGLVAEIEISSYQDFKEYLQLRNLELYDINNKLNPIQKQVDFKFQDKEYYINSTTGKEEFRLIWKDISEFQYKGNEVVKIGLFTDVKLGEKVEWIPTILNERIDEWAGWAGVLTITADSGWSTQSDTPLQGVGATINGEFWVNNITKAGSQTSTWGVVTGHYANGTFVTLARASFSGNNAVFSTPAHVTTAFDKVYFWGDNNGGTYTSAYKTATHPLGNTTWYSTYARTWANYPNYDSFGDFQTNYVSGIVSVGIQNFAPTTETDLIITLQSPLNNANLSSSTNFFTANVTDTGLVAIANVSLLINGTITDTNTSGISGVYEWNKTLTDGSYNWTVIAYGNDSIQYNASNGTLFFTIDLIEPTVTLDSPANATDSNRLDWNLVSNLTAGNYTLNNATTYVWFSNGTLFKAQTNTSISGTSDVQLNETIEDVPFGLTYFWNVRLNYENPTLSTFNSVWATNNFTFTRLPFEVTGESFNTTALETDSETFYINISTIPDILSTSIQLVYNGDSYFVETNCINSVCILEKTIDIPLVTAGTSQNKTFYWALMLFDGTTSFSFNTTEHNQNVSRIFFESQSANATIKTANFTLYDEETLSQINTMKFQGTFNTWLGSGSQYRNSSFNDASVVNRTIYISHNRTFYSNATINYNNATGDIYNTRQYYFQKHQFTNTSQDFFLYLLNTTSSTSFIIKVQDISLFPIENVLVKILRYYPGTDQYRIVQIVKTDQAGKGIGFYKTETIEYKHNITSNGNILLETERQKVFPEEAPFTLTFTIGEAVTPPYEDFEEDPNINTTLSFNKTSKIVTYNYIDSTGDTTQGSLLIERIYPNQTSQIICWNNLSLSAGTITCNLSTYDSGNFIAKGYVGTGTTLTKLINFVIETVSDVLERHGLILAWFIILTAGLAGIWNPTVSIIFVNVAVIFVNLIGLVAFSPVWIFGLIGVSITLIAIINN